MMEDEDNNQTQGGETKRFKSEDGSAVPPPAPPVAEAEEEDEEKKSDDVEVQTVNEQARMGEEEEANTEGSAANNNCCCACQFPTFEDTTPFFKLVTLREEHGKNGKALCQDCQDKFQQAATKFCEEREVKLSDPFNPHVFPAPMLKMGGVGENYMASFLRIKHALTASAARMRDFGSIPATSGKGKFQYFVGDKSVSEKGWDWRDHKLLKAHPQDRDALERFALNVVASQLPLGRDGYRMDPGFVMTRQAVVQGPHRDYKGYDAVYANDTEDGNNDKNGISDTRDLKKLETQFMPWVLHMPLVKEGMDLNYWPDNWKANPPIRIHIPFGTYLMMRVDAVHGGCLGNPGNLRLHIAYSPRELAIKKLGEELTEQSGLTKEVVKRYSSLGAPDAGHEQRELDLLKSDLSQYRDPEDVNDCIRDYAITFADPEYCKRLLDKFPNDLSPESVENVSLSTTKKNNKQPVTPASSSVQA